MAFFGHALVILPPFSSPLSKKNDPKVNSYVFGVNSKNLLKMP